MSIKPHTGRKTSCHLLICLFLLCIGSNVRAQGSQGSGGTDHDGGWVIAAYTGGARTGNSELIVSQPSFGTDLSFHDVRFNSRSFDPPLYYGVRGGYFLRCTPSIGFEAEFIHLKIFTDPQQRVRARGVRRNVATDTELPLGDIVQQYSISHGVNLLLFNVAVSHRLREAADGRLSLTARAGLGPTLPHTESRIEGEPQEQYEVGRLAWQVSGGAEFKLWRGLHFRWVRSLNEICRS